MEHQTSTAGSYLVAHAFHIMLLEDFIKRLDNIQQLFHWCEQIQRLGKFDAVPFTYLWLPAECIPASSVCRQQ